MHNYVARRLLMFVPTLVGASLLIFVLMRMVPGDIAEILVYQTATESSAIQERQITYLVRVASISGLSLPSLDGRILWDNCARLYGMDGP